MRAVFVVALLVSLAGCADGGAPVEEEDDSFDEFDLEDTQDDLGNIRGVVLDASLQPVAGVEVILLNEDKSVVTKENGAFAFKDLAPGVYFLRTNKTTFESAQASAEVKAGVKEPPVTKILMQRIPGSEPQAVPHQFAGHITCSLRIPAAGFNDGCVLFGGLGLGTTQREDVQWEPGNIHFIQIELIWEPNGETSKRLCTRLDRADRAEPACGEPYHVSRIERASIEANGLHANQTYHYVVYPDHLLMDVSGNIVVDQGFDVFHYAFYNFVPDADWTFGADGPPELPE